MRARLRRLKALASRSRWRSSTQGEWAYVPEGWASEDGDPRIKGWNVDAIVEAYRARWPSFLEAIAGSGPLGVSHETRDGVPIRRDQPGAQNVVVAFGYALALAGRSRQRVSVLDWGGGGGHSYALSKALLSEVELDYTIKDLPKLCAYGRSIAPGARFFEDESCLESRYDLVLASSSLQYAPEWREVLAGLAAATRGYLFVTRLPVVEAERSFVVLQRPYAHGYATEYLGWALSRSELLAASAELSLSVVREFVFDHAIHVPGAPANPIRESGFLFRPV